jgi:hypothetical protein
LGTVKTAKELDKSSPEQAQNLVTTLRIEHPNFFRDVDQNQALSDLEFCMKEDIKNYNKQLKEINPQIDTLRNPFNSIPNP